MPKQIHPWVDDLQFAVVVGGGDLTGRITRPPEKDRKGSSNSHSNRQFDRGRKVEGDVRTHSNFKKCAHSFPDPGLHSRSELRQATGFIRSGRNPGSVLASLKLHHASQMGHGVSHGPGLFSFLKRADSKYCSASCLGDYSNKGPRGLKESLRR